MGEALHMEVIEELDVLWGWRTKMVGKKSTKKMMTYYSRRTPRKKPMEIISIPEPMCKSGETAGRLEKLTLRTDPAAGNSARGYRKEWACY
jgi:hypothetical protein